MSSIGLRRCKIIMKEKTPLLHKVVCFQMLDLRSRNQNRGKLLLSQKLCYFSGSPYSQCFILSKSLFLEPSKCLCQKYFWVIIVSIAFKDREVFFLKTNCEKYRIIQRKLYSHLRVPFNLRKSYCQLSTNYMKKKIQINITQCAVHSLYERTGIGQLPLF